MASKNKGSAKKQKRRKGEDHDPQLAPMAAAEVRLQADDVTAGKAQGGSAGRAKRKSSGGESRSRPRAKRSSSDAAVMGSPMIETPDGSGSGSSLTAGLRNRVAALGEYGSAITEYGRDGLTRAGSAVRTGASTVGRAAKDGLERGREITAEGWESHPLAICGAALALGALAGLLLPSTEVEDRVMGDAADRVNDRVRQATSGLVEQGKTRVGTTLGEAAAATVREAENLGLTPDEVGRKVKRLASLVREAVSGVVEKRQRG